MRTSSMLLGVALSVGSGCGGCDHGPAATIDASTHDSASNDGDIDALPDAPVDAPRDAPVVDDDDECTGASPICTTAPTTFYAIPDTYFEASMAALDGILYVSVYQSVNGTLVSSEVDQIDLWTGNVVGTILAGKNPVLSRVGDWIYAIGSDGTISRFRPGASIETLVTGRTNLQAVIADADTLYWAEGTTAGQVFRMPLAGGTPEVVMNCPNAWRLRVDATNVYCEEFGQSMLQASKTGTTANATQILYSSYPLVGLAQCPDATLYAVAVGSQSVFTVPTPDGPGVVTTNINSQLPPRITGLSASANDLYVTTSRGMFKMTRAGGIPTRITTLDAENDPVVWNGQLFFFSRGTGIRRCTD